MVRKLTHLLDCNIQRLYPILFVFMSLIMSSEDSLAQALDGKVADMGLRESEEDPEVNLSFSEFPEGTLMSDQYAPLGLAFTDGSPAVTSEFRSPWPPALAGFPPPYGAIEAEFIDPEDVNTAHGVTYVRVSAGHFESEYAFRLRWFDAEGQVLGQVSNDFLATDTLVVESGVISSFRVEGWEQEKIPFVIDNIRYIPEEIGGLVFRRGEETNGGSGARTPAEHTGFDHVGLHHLGLVYESHPGYQGTYVSADGSESVVARHKNGAQQTHTLGTWSHNSHNDLYSPITAYVELPLPAEWVEKIAIWMDKLAYEKAPFHELNSTTFEAWVETAEPLLQKGAKGAYSAVGIIEKNAERVLYRGGAGFVADRFESMSMSIMEADGSPMPTSTAFEEAQDSTLWGEKIPSSSRREGELSPIEMMAQPWGQLPTAYYWKIPLLTPELLSHLVVKGEAYSDQENWLQVVGHLSDFMITNPLGQRSGFLGDVGLQKEIAGTLHTGEGVLEVLLIPNPIPGRYQLERVGLGVQSRVGISGNDYEYGISELLLVDQVSVSHFYVPPKVGSRGDLNGDGILDEVDLVDLEERAGQFAESLYDPADLTGDGRIDGEDVLALRTLLDQTLIPPVGDFNYDGQVDEMDLIILGSSLGHCHDATEPRPKPDLDGDGCVTFFDQQLWRSLL